MAIFTTGRNIGRTIKGAGRLRTILSVFARHGFQNILERARLGRYVIKTFIEVDAERYTAAERVRMAFEELGPTFVKFGQLLATRSDLIPEDFVSEFKKLHDQVEPEPFTVIKNSLEGHFKSRLENVFLQFEEAPIGSASIAQVHRAQLVDGTEVVVKVQRPKIEKMIDDDLSVLFTLAGLLDKYIPELQALNLEVMVEEFFKALQLETNFIVEANNIRRFQKNFEHDTDIVIPQVYAHISGRKVLVLEYLNGTALSHPKALELHQTDTEKVVRSGLHAFFKMVFIDGFFHGDLHAGNLIILNNSQIGLIDFGVVGRLSRKAQDAIAGMFVSLANEDYEQLAFEYLEIAANYEYIDLDILARDLREIIAPQFGLTFKDVNVGKLLMSSAQVAAKHKLRIPSELMLLFRSLVTVEGLGRLLVDDFDVLSYSHEFTAELIKTKYDPARMTKDFFRLAKESADLVTTLPRQAKILLKRMGNPDHAWKVNIDQMDELRHSIEKSSDHVFYGLIISSLILSSSALLFLEATPLFFGVPIFSAVGYLMAFLLTLFR